MTVTMTNVYTAHFPSVPTTISGSQFKVFVYPGLVNPSLCYSDVPSSNILEQTANVAYNFKIYFVDFYGNLHF